MESKSMVAMASTGASSEIKEQYEKHKKFGWGDFLFFLHLHLQKLKGGSVER